MNRQVNDTRTLHFTCGLSFGLKKDTTQRKNLKQTNNNNMKRIAKHYSGIRFTRASMAMGLTALLCMPLQASAEESTSTAPVAQAVQQSRTVKGQVVDEMGEPMIGVTVRVKGTGKGTITDMDGRFSIQAESNATLEISFVGYKTQTFKASKTNS